MSVDVDPSNKDYELAELRFANETILCESFSADIEISKDFKTVTNSKDPVGYTGRSREITIEASGILPEFHDFLMDAILNETLFTIATYNFEDGGEPKESDVFYNCTIEKVSISEEDSRSLEISGKALSVKH